MSSYMCICHNMKIDRMQFAYKYGHYFTGRVAHDDTRALVPCRRFNATKSVGASKLVHLKDSVPRSKNSYPVLALFYALASSFKACYSTV
jgi:hypothetical protein